LEPRQFVAQQFAGAHREEDGDQDRRNVAQQFAR
jgi:hypothetical protein